MTPSSLAGPRRSPRRKGTASSVPVVPRPRPARTAPADVYGRLRDLIVGGQLAPGGRLVEIDLAGRLGVSRTPVRDALRRLRQEGLVHGDAASQQARLSVTPLTRADADELLAIVGALEGVAAARAAQLPDAARARLVATLTRLNARFERAARTRAPELETLYRADERFHRCYVEAASGPRLLALHDAVKPQAERYIRMYISLLAGDVGPSLREHHEVVRQIAAGEAEGAERAVRVNWHHAAIRLGHVISVAGELGGAW